MAKYTPPPQIQQPEPKPQVHPDRVMTIEEREAAQREKKRLAKLPKD